MGGGVSLDRAQQQYETAFHLLNVTFRSLQDPKLLLGVVYNLSRAVEFALDVLLAEEHITKKLLTKELKMIGGARIFSTIVTDINFYTIISSYYKEMRYFGDIINAFLI